MNRPQTRPLFFFLIILNVVILPFLTNIVSALFPLAEFSTRARILFLLAYLVVALCAVIGAYLFDRASEDPQKVARSSEAWSARFNRLVVSPFRDFFQRALEKLAKLLLIWKDVISKSSISRTRFVLLFIGLAMLLLWFIAKRINDGPWKAKFAQVDYLDTAIAWQRRELSLRLGYFGAETSEKAEPHTILTRAGYGEAVLALAGFEKYLRIIPARVPRNNLTVTLSAANNAASLRDALEALTRSKHVERTSGTFWKPAVYTLELYAKTSGNQQEFRRRYHIRERAPIEILAFALGSLFLAAFAVLILNIPATARKAAAYDRLSSWLDRIFFVMLRIIKIAALLGLPVAGIIEALREITDAVTEIIKKFGKGNEHEAGQLVETQFNRLKTKLESEGRISQSKSRELTSHIVSMVRVIEIIDHRFIIVQEDRAGCEALLGDAEKAAGLAGKEGANLTAKYNDLLRRHKEEHERHLEESRRSLIADFEEKLRREDFQKLLANFGNQRNLNSLEDEDLLVNPEGEVLSKLNVRIRLKKYEALHPSSGKTVFTLQVGRENKNLLLAEKGMTAIAVPALHPEQLAGTIAYNLRFKPVTLTSPEYALRESVHDLLRLEPVDARVLAQRYKEKTLEDFEI